MSTVKIRTLCRGLAIGASSVMLAAAAQAQVAVPAQAENVSQNSFQVMDEEVVRLNVPSHRNVLRAPPPVPGGGCQANGDYADATGIFNSIGINPTAFMRADNFRPSGTGPLSLTSVSWSGWTQAGASPNIVNAANPTSFTVTIFNDAAGLPGTVIGSIQTVTPTVTNGGTVPPQGAGAGQANVTLSDFTATLPTAVALTGGTCYWIEIRPAATITGYVWRTSDQGDAVNYRRTATGTPYATTGIRTGDLSFCTNLALDSQAGGNSCAVNSTMTCATPSQASCQIYDGTGLANFSTKAPPVGGTVTFRSADNFTVNSATTITGGCFQGVFALAAGQTLPVAAADSFDISVFQDAGGAQSGVPGALVATRVVTPTDGALLRGAAVTTAFATNFSWSFNLAGHSQGPIALPAPGCYWIEIVYNDSVIRWAWFVKSNARATGLADDFRQTQASTVNGGAYDLLSQQFSGDFAWCLQGPGATLVRSTTCVPIPAMTNLSCTSATALTLGAPAIFGHNLGDATIIPPACLSRIPNINGVWYTVIGNGNDITVSTCNTGANPFAAQTNFDSVISVYCSQTAAPNECNGPVVCIGTNDDDPTPCGLAGDLGASAITFPTVAGQKYFVYVYGFEAGNGAISQGFFYVSATSSGTPSDPSAVACNNLVDCVIDVPSGALVETDLCGATSNNSACDGTSVNSLPLGTVGVGFMSNNGATRDFDFWRLPDVSAADQWFDITIKTEFPAIMQIGRGTCVAGAVPVVQLGVNSCQSGLPIRVQVPPGEFYINVLVNSFNGLPCFVGDVGNRYTLLVTPVAEVGACCITGTACIVTARSGGVGGDTVSDCETQGGFFFGNGTTCDAGTNAPCDPAGGPPAGTIVGSCCLPFADCALTTDTTCSGGVFTAAGVCNPNTCAANLATCCNASGTCFIAADAAACTSAGGTPQAVLRPCTPNACPQAPTGGCCSATFTCSTSTQAACVGTWLGANVACTPANCVAAPSGVCCRGATCNAAVVQGSCNAAGTAGASFSNAGSTCNAIGNTTTPCCFADYNKVNSIEINDIFDFLNDWFAGANFADTGGDGTTAPDINSIFDFLNAWFAGGC